MIGQIRDYFDENRLFYGVVLALIAANIAFLIFLKVPRQKIHEELKREYFDLRKERSALSEGLKARGEENVRLEELGKELEAFVGELPSPDGMTSIIKEIHRLARKEGLAIRSAKYSPAQRKGKDLLSYSVSFPLAGTYRQIRRFIYDIENMPHLISIDDLSIASSRAGTVSLSLRLSLYFRQVQ